MTRDIPIDEDKLVVHEIPDNTYGDTMVNNADGNNEIELCLNCGKRLNQDKKCDQHCQEIIEHLDYVSKMKCRGCGDYVFPYETCPSRNMTYKDDERRKHIEIVQPHYQIKLLDSVCTVELCIGTGMPGFIKCSVCFLPETLP